MRRRTFGRPKLGDLTGWSLITIFGAVVVRGQVRGEPFTRRGAVLRWGRRPPDVAAVDEQGAGPGIASG